MCKAVLEVLMLNRLSVCVCVCVKLICMCQNTAKVYTLHLVNYDF